MKKKFLRGIAATLAVVMMMPTAALADQTDQNEQQISQQSEEIVLKILKGEDDVTDDTVNLSTEGSNSTATLTIDKGYDVDWSSNKKSVVTVENGKLTAKGVGTATITAQYEGKEATCTVTVSARTLSKINIVGTPKDKYVTGESFSFGTAIVEATYSDESKEDVTSKCTVSPSEDLRKTDTSVTVKYKEGEKEVTASVAIAVTDDTITGITIVSPSTGAKYKVGDTIARSSVSIEVSYAVGKPVTLNAEDYSDITISPSGALAKTDKELTVSYGGQSDKILIAVEEEQTTPTKTITGIDARPSKVEYSKGDSVSKLSDLKVYLKYSDGSEEQLATSNFTVSPSTLNTTGDAVTVTVKLNKTGVAEFTDTYEVKVKNVSVATEINKDPSDYELWDKEDIEIKVGDVLNTDIKWYDIFKEVRVKIDGTWRTIDHKNDLENYPGVELLLKVYNKDSEEIKASYVDSDGNVRIQLCFRNGSGSVVTDTSVTIREYIPVSEAGCTATAYRSKTSSSVTGTPITESELDDILDILEERSDAISALGVSNSYKENFAVTIKLGKDQDLGSYSFEPDHDHVITIDLNGHDLELDSDWIEYNRDNEDLVVIITNTSSSSGTLKYGDKNVTLTVANGSKLEFTEGNIPMDTDAECTVTIYKNGNSTSSSALLKTKVFETLKDALKSLEDQNDAVDEYEIDNDYEDTFVVKMKLGEDQDLDDYTFAPDYDTTISIDLNGCEVELESEWIDYDNCDDLVVKFNNTNSKTKGKLKYSDISNTAVIEVASGDSALTFEKDKIPGIYKVEIASAANGTVKASPNKETALKGSTVTFTITPDTGYEIDTVKNGTKTIAKSSSGYTVDSKGVGTCKVTVSADVSLKVTFKKAAASSSTSSSSSTNQTLPFTDVTKGTAYYDAVAYVYDVGLMNGVAKNAYTPATEFQPLKTMTRAEFVTTLGRLAGIEKDDKRYSGTSFTDVSTTDDAKAAWAATYIQWAAANNITKGIGDNKFGPNDPVTHEQMYTFMYRVALLMGQSSSLTGINLNSIKTANGSLIKDASEVQDWAIDAVKFASKYGILITSDSKLTPTQNAYRCELAMLLHGFCVKVLER